MKTKIYVHGTEINSNIENKENYWEVSEKQLVEILDLFNKSEEEPFAGVISPNGNRPIVLTGIVIQKNEITTVNPNEHIGKVISKNNLFANLYD